MADTKVPDLTESTIPADDDLIHVVDVSDTTDSAAGTSKYSQFKNVRGTPRTAAEIAAVITPTNYQYEPGNVLRYGTNTTPGTTDMSTAFQNALDSNKKVILPGETMRVDTGLAVPQGVSIYGEGLSSSIDYRGTAACFTNTSGNFWFHQVFSDFEILLTSNANSNVDCMVALFGANSCLFSNIRLKVDSACRHGFEIDGNNGSTSNNNQYNNVFLNCRTQSISTDATGKALYLNGNDVTDERCNSNIVIGGIYDGFPQPFYVNGNGNWLGNITINGPAGSGAVIIEGTGAFDNTLEAIYFDSAISGNNIELINPTAVAQHMVNINNCLQVKAPADVVRSGTGSADVSFSIKNRGITVGGSTPSGLNTSDSRIIQTSNNNGLVHFLGGEAYNSGRIIVSGDEFAGGINAVSDNGGTSAVINDDASAEYRICKTANGSSYTKLFSVDNSGVMTALTGPFISAVNALDDTGTPSVAGGNVFTTGGTTAITDFDGGILGQTIKIKAAHSVTITDGAPIVLSGSANYTMTDTDTLTLTMYVDQVWTEDARSVN